jgi:hypothetical protein
MKVVYFDNTRNITKILENVINPQFYGLHEVRWENGGDTFFEDYYVILEDEIDFETVTEEEFLRQYKEQSKFDLARYLESNKLYFMVNGTTSEKEAEFISDKTGIDNLQTIEEVKLYMTQVKERNIGLGQ